MEYNEFDPWEEFGLRCVNYNSQIDEDMINVMKCIKNKKYNSDIAVELNLSEQYVELLQSILCSKNICEYGTSPRGCWFMHSIDADEYINKWQEYYKNNWERTARNA
jgi:hypothetical protein